MKFRKARPFLHIDMVVATKEQVKAPFNDFFIRSLEEVEFPSYFQV